MRKPKIDDIDDWFFHGDTKLISKIWGEILKSKRLKNEKAESETTFDADMDM